MEWIEKLDGNVIVSDAKGRIIYMNEKALSHYEKDGGINLIGSDLLECHNESSRKKIMEIMTSGQKNVYTIEKKGKKKMMAFGKGKVDIPPEAFLSVMKR